VRHAAGGSARLMDPARRASRSQRHERSETAARREPRGPAGAAGAADLARAAERAGQAGRAKQAEPAQRGSPPRGSPPRGGRRRRAGKAGLAGRQRLGAAYLIVLCGVALSLSYMWRGPQNVRGGTLAVAGMLLAAAVARLVLPDRSAGMLASRRRLADVAAFAVLGVALLVAGLVFPAQR